VQLQDYRADYYAFTTRTSETVRQLSFAGIALIWVLRPNTASVDGVPRELLLPAALFVLVLAFDLLQSAFGAALWGLFCRFQEKRGKKDDDELDTPAFYNWPTIFFFWGKVILLVVAYWFALVHIVSLIRLS